MGFTDLALSGRIIHKNLRPSINLANCDISLKKIIEKGWEQDPAKRPPLKDFIDLLQKMILSIPKPDLFSFSRVHLVPQPYQSTKVSGGYDVFISHYQRTGEDLAKVFKLTLEQQRPGIKVFLDRDDLSQIHSLEV